MLPRYSGGSDGSGLGRCPPGAGAAVRFCAGILSGAETPLAACGKVVRSGGTLARADLSRILRHLLDGTGGWAGSSAALCRRYIAVADPGGGVA